MRITFICPFNLDRLTGTPIRTRTTISAASHVGQVYVVSQGYTAVADGVECSSVTLGGLLSFTKKSLSILKQFRPDVVHGVTTAAVPTLLLYRYLFNARVRIVYEMHGWAWFEMHALRRPFTRTIFLLLDRLGLLCADAVIVMSYTQKDFLLRYIASDQKITVIWGPVDTIPKYSAPRAESDVVTFGYLGNDAWWQGLPLLLEAAQRLSIHKNITFVVGGFDASDEASFPRLSNVHYLGKVPREEVFIVLQKCDVLLSPRIPGGVSDLQYPHKLSEYLSAARPVIASSTSDQPHIITTAKCGVIVEPLTIENLIHSIVELSAYSQQGRIAMGERSYAFACSYFSLTSLIHSLKSIYSTPSLQ